MIWIASFPRSGNTFFRNVLSEVYNIESSTYHQEDYPLDENYHTFPFVKTHLLPEQLPFDTSIPAVYLVRDGRDALISLAHHRSDIISPGTDFNQNLREAILAAEGSYFGGWSANVEAWLERAAIIIRFEDLIKDPIKEIERIRAIYPELPRPNKEKLPTFESQKFGSPRYGSGKKIAPEDESKANEITGNWFRKGKINGWKDEFPSDLIDLFWSYHREMMVRLGYTITGDVGVLDKEFDFLALEKTGHQLTQNKNKKRVLIEANKLMMLGNDGIKRYVSELLKGLYPVSQNPYSQWEIDVFMDGSIRKLSECSHFLFDSAQNENRKAVKQSLFRKTIHYSKIVFRKILPKSIYRFIANILTKILIKFRLKTGKEVLKKIAKFQQNGEEKMYDLIHIPLFQHFEPFTDLNGPFVVTVHDMTHREFPEFHTTRNIELAEKGLTFFLGKNSNFIAISESTRQSFMQVSRQFAEKSLTVPEAADFQKFKPLFNTHLAVTTKRTYFIPENTPFILTLSTLEPRKNLLNTIAGFEKMLEDHPQVNANLVIAGPAGWHTKELKKYRRNKRILFTGFINEFHLPALYNEAAALCYVSRNEGFGLPILEAMACGTPVIFGNNSSMKEYFSGFGLAADPDDIQEIANHMYLLLSNPEAQKHYSSLALQRSFDFSWRKTAMQTLQAYEKFINIKAKFTS